VEERLQLAREQQRKAEEQHAAAHAAFVRVQAELEAERRGRAGLQQEITEWQNRCNRVRGAERSAMRNLTTCRQPMTPSASPAR
jgi:hypothetical protein